MLGYILKKIVFHPFLFAIFWILSVFSHNICLVKFHDIISPLTILMVVILLGMAVAFFILKDLQKSGLIILVTLIGCLFYESITNCVKYIDFEIAIGSAKIGLNDLLAVCSIMLLIHVIIFYKRKPGLAKKCGIILTYLCLFILVNSFRLENYRSLFYLFSFIFFGYNVSKNIKNPDNLTKFLNITTLILVALNLFNIGNFIKKTKSISNIKINHVINMDQVKVDKSLDLPDIYHIVPDTYARSDILKEIYQFDNSDFINYLTEKGFYVSNNATSGYPRTLYAFSSVLNLNYLDNLIPKMDDIITVDHRLIPYQLTKIYRDNDVLNFLKKYGYTIVTFWMGYDFIEIPNTDVYLKSSDIKEKGSSCKSPGVDITVFQSMLINTTIMRDFLKLVSSDKMKRSISLDSRRKTALFKFNKAGNMQEVKSPKYVFCHIEPPHPPYVFDRDGNEIDPSKQQLILSQKGMSKEEINIFLYKEELIFINKMLRKTIDNILAQSPKPPIIILQSDTGPYTYFDKENAYFRESFSILSACYLPDGGDEYMYDSLSSINTYRIIFNHYFNTDYELLPTRNYWYWDGPNKFIDVTDQVSSGANAPTISIKE